MKDMNKYVIVRSSNGDMVARMYKGYTIHNSGLYEVHTVDVPPQWRTLDPTRCPKKFMEVVNCSDIPIVLDQTYLSILGSLQMKQKKRQICYDKLREITSKKGLWNNIKVWYYKRQYHNLRDITPEQFEQKFRKYRTPHKIVKWYERWY